MAPVIIVQSTCGSSPASVAMTSVSASTHKRKRVVLTISDKLKICQLVKGGKALQSIAKEYDVGKSTVHNIVSAVSQNFNYPNILIIRTPFGPTVFG